MKPNCSKVVLGHNTCLKLAHSKVTFKFYLLGKTLINVFLCSFLGYLRRNLCHPKHVKGTIMSGDFAVPTGLKPGIIQSIS